MSKQSKDRVPDVSNHDVTDSETRVLPMLQSTFCSTSPPSRVKSSLLDVRRGGSGTLNTSLVAAFALTFTDFSCKFTDLSTDCRVTESLFEYLLVALALVMFTVLVRSPLDGVEIFSGKTTLPRSYRIVLF